MKDELNYDSNELKSRLEINVTKLNLDQRCAFATITNSITTKSNKTFFIIDGPGGTGKTFLYNCLLDYVRSQKKIA